MARKLKLLDFGTENSKWLSAKRFQTLPKTLRMKRRKPAASVVVVSVAVAMSPPTAAPMPLRSCRLKSNSKFVGFNDVFFMEFGSGWLTKIKKENDVLSSSLRHSQGQYTEIYVINILLCRFKIVIWNSMIRRKNYCKTILQTKYLLT